jgi:apolipoprotein N-acyltransferase
MSRLRAVEHGRSVVIAATSGISAVIAPDGTVVRRSGLFTPAAFDLPIAQRTGTTLADRVRSGPEWTLTALGVAAVVAAAVRSRRGRPAA